MDQRKNSRCKVALEARQRNLLEHEASLKKCSEDEQLVKLYKKKIELTKKEITILTSRVMA